MALDGIRYLSFAGAGTSGYAYAGFLDALEQSREYDAWRRSLQGVAGTSAGALAALSVVLGLDARARKSIPPLPHLCNSRVLRERATRHGSQRRGERHARPRRRHHRRASGRHGLPPCRPC